MLLVLLGPRGSGKSSIGRRAADQLWRPFVDTDALIVQSAGRPIREIFQNDGESVFRDLEEKAVAEACAKEDAVIALGGGAVLREANRKLLASLNGARVYLRADPQALADRIAADATTADSRPALTPLGGGVDEVRHLLTLREPLYREVATAELDVTHLSIDEATERILRLL